MGPSRAVSAALVFLTAVSTACAAGAADDYPSAILLAVDHWLAVQRPTGLMPYGYDFLKDRALEPDTISATNLVRQAYTAAVLADYYAATHDARVRPAVQRYLRGLNRYSRPIGKGRLQRLVEDTGLLSLPFGRYKLRAALQRLGLLYQTSGPGRVLSPSADYGQAHTGAVALALLAELRYYQADGDTAFAGLRRSWLDGLLALWIPGEGFREVPNAIDTTPYYDGEAWLALAHYHHLFPDDTRVNALLDEVDATLLHKYGDARRRDFFHWGTMAAAARYTDTGDPRFPAFIAAQLQAFLARSAGDDAGDNPCATAEGMIDALSTLGRAGNSDGAVAGRAGHWLSMALHTAVQLQIRPGQTEIALGGARIVAPAMQRFAGAFRSGLYGADTQIDLTAHCVAAMMKFLRLEGGPVAPTPPGAVVRRP